VPTLNDFNEKIIDEFRANGGKVGGAFEGSPLLLLQTTGAKTGRTRVKPLVYRRDGDRLVVFGTKGGSPTHPEWYHSVRANPRVTVEVGSDRFEADAKSRPPTSGTGFGGCRRRTFPYSPTTRRGPIAGSRLSSSRASRRSVEG
jgi:deazaflavin-dependent oxidoreductase (nitroreductase family)